MQSKGEIISAATAAATWRDRCLSLAQQCSFSTRAAMGLRPQPFREAWANCEMGLLQERHPHKAPAQSSAKWRSCHSPDFTSACKQRCAGGTRRQGNGHTPSSHSNAPRAGLPRPHRPRPRQCSQTLPQPARPWPTHAQSRCSTVPRVLDVLLHVLSETQWIYIWIRGVLESLHTNTQDDSTGGSLAGKEE